MEEVTDEIDEGFNGGFHEMEELTDETDEGFNGGFHEMEELTDETDEGFNGGFHEMDELADRSDEEFDEQFDEMGEITDEELDKEFDEQFNEMGEITDEELDKEFDEQFDEMEEVTDEELDKEFDEQFDEMEEVTDEELDKEFDEQFNEMEEEYENIGSQSTVLIPEKSEIEGENQEELQAESEEYTEEEDEHLGNEEEAIEIDPEEYENDQDPIIDTEEIEFVRDMEELGRMLKEYDEKLGYPEEENDNTAFNAEQAYREIKERKNNKEEKGEGQELEEHEKEITEEQKEEQIEEIHSGEAQEEDVNDTSEEAEIEPEEFDYLWEKYEQYEQEGNSSEEIRNLMQEAEETYNLLKSVEKLYEHQEKEKLKSVDHEDEEDEEDVREEIDRVDAIEYLADSEEELYQQGKYQEEIDEKMEELADNFFLVEIEENQQNEHIKDVSEELKIEQAEIDEEHLALEGQEQNGQISVYDNDENLEARQEMDRKEPEEDVYTELDDIEVDEVQSYQERIKETIEKEKKSEREETEEEEYEQLQQLYRQETGKRPIYAGKDTKGFSQWLEQQDLKTKQLEEREKQEEKWQKKLKKWIEGSTEEELSSEIKEILKEILHNFQDYEDLEELYKKYENGELTEMEREELLSIIKKLRHINPIYLHLYLNIRGFKAYFQESHWWNPWLINEIKYKFLRHLSNKYEVLKQHSINISKFKQLHAKHIRKLIYNISPIKSVGLINYKKKLNHRENALYMKHKKKNNEIATVPPPNITHFKQKAINIRKGSNRILLIRYLKKLDLKNILIIYSFFLRYYNTSDRPANFGSTIKNEFKDWLKFNCFSSQIQKNLLLKACKNINENQEFTRLIIEIIKTSKYSLNKIATLLKSIGLYISYVTIRKIALKKVYYDKYNLYKERFPAKNARISNTKKEKIITELKKKNPPSLRKIAKIFSVSQRTIIRIALSLYKENIYLYHKKWAPTSNYITKAQKENILIELEKKNPYTLQKIAQLSSVSPMSVYRMANDLYKDKRDIYRQKFNRHHLPKNKRDQIKKDIINSKLNIREIARKNNVSHSSVWFIALKFFKDNRKAYKIRFPNEDYLDIGNESHNCINFLLTDFFDKILNEKYYSEPRYLKDSNKGPDGLIMKEVFQKVLSFNINRNKLINEIGLDLRTIANICAVIFDFTNDVSEENIKKKISKYQNKNLFFFIVGIRWHKSWDTRIKNIPLNDNIVLRKNCFVINYELFEDLIGLTKEYKDKFEKIVKLNLKRALNSLIDFHEELRCDLHKSDELINELEKL